jgi:hypothetical protein
MAALLEFRNLEAWHGPIPAPRGICHLIDPRVGAIRCAGQVMHGRDPGKVVASTRGGKRGAAAAPA